jgi:AcrR family transcriptional regulator
MDRPPEQVKRARTYDASRRKEKARRQYTAALDAAHELFLDGGYATTTVESIAVAAGVSAATIYKSYGGKAGLVRALCHRALAGAGPTPAEERSNTLRSRSDPREVLEGWGRLTAEVSPRIAPLLLLLRNAAQADVEAASLFDDLERVRLARMADNATYLATAGHLRSGLSAREARDVLWLCSSPEMYDLLVNRRRWSIRRYSRFVTETMINALL